MQEYKTERKLGYWLHQIGTSFKSHIDRHTATLGITAPEAFLIFHLFNLESGCLVDLSERLGYAHPSVLRHIDSLEKTGYLQRLPHPEDRRKKVVELTPKGQALVPKIKAKLMQVHNKALSGISDHDQDLLFTLLKKIHKNLQDSEINENSNADNEFKGIHDLPKL